MGNQVKQTVCAEMSIHPWVESNAMRELRSYDRNWAAVYQVLRGYIERNVRDVSVEHIGSTAVPELKSKSMVDMLVITQRQDLQEVKRALVALGFHERDVWVDTEDKPYVCGSVVHAGTTYDVNVHVCRLDSATHVNSLRFRDALRREANLRREYEAIKMKAIREVGNNPEEYNKFKSRFIQRVIEAESAHVGDATGLPADG